MLQIHHRTDAEVLAEYGALVIRAIDGAPTEIEDVDRASDLIDELLERRANIGVLVIVEHGSPAPTPECMRHMRRRSQPRAERLVVGFAMLGLGFWAKAALHLTQVAVQAMNMSMFAGTELRPVVEGMSRELVGLDPATILALCEQLRAELAAARSQRPPGASSTGD
ncbi:hypothetical protein G6O69_05825 [Pseudenhygromyxa sp. WMMC2535]|uniref:hypothetical protein n=1 Tax=Pseudenhygromyxa sp. WMMC2535 TaxID=2712867 RepID=UPI001553240F|nr:hypothetical protein [Pseudenhygromyxa sp. WMMC2535]NVB37341.1 hypothetical protein [Pseudenhygromyxa sp. WMMC2535]